MGFGRFEWNSSIEDGAWNSIELDTGLACHLIGLDPARLKADGNARGPLLENFVTMELVKQAGWSELQPRLCHFRTPAGREVDIVREAPGGWVVGVEVKSFSGVHADDFAGLRTLLETVREKFVRGIVLYGGSEIVAFEKGMLAVPHRAVWMTGS